MPSRQRRESSGRWRHPLRRGCLQGTGSGADGVLICRPFVTAVYGGGEEGVKCYIDKIAGELADTMQMCGAHSIREITREMVRI